MAEKVRVGNASGFFITSDGYFVTNNHVVDGADSVAVKFGDAVFPARVIKTDASNDIAILKLDGTFPCLPLGDDLQTRPGEDVFTVGFPMTDVMGEAPKTTLGTVSAITGVLDDPRTFQISVQIQPGNSGGPLVLKSTGNVIGVTSSSLNAAKYLQGGRAVPQNVNYAMKASYIRPLLTTVPGLVEKLPKFRVGERPWREVQQDVEKGVGLVFIYKDSARLQPPQPTLQHVERDPLPPHKENPHPQPPQPSPSSADLKALEKKATAGDAEAQIALGLAYDQGRGIEQDRRKAAEWFGKAAVQGVAEAQFNLAILCASGVGVAKDEAKAVAWFERAATQGLVDAQFNLANMYADGRGTEKNPAKALEWYEKAATKGMTRAQFNLALLYALGQDVPKDTVKAYAWFAIAAADGDPAAKQNRDFIEKKLNAAQKAKFKKAAEELAKKIKP